MEKETAPNELLQASVSLLGAVLGFANWEHIYSDFSDSSCSSGFPLSQFSFCLMALWQALCPWDMCSTHIHYHCNRIFAVLGLSAEHSDELCPPCQHAGSFPIWFSQFSALWKIKNCHLLFNMDWPVNQNIREQDSSMERRENFCTHLC